MLTYLALRVAAAGLILLGVTAISFGLMFLLPADPVRMMVGRNPTPQMMESIRKDWGLDRSLPERYVRYVAGVAQGDLGRSYIQKLTVAGLILWVWLDGRARRRELAALEAAGIRRRSAGEAK